MAALGPRFAERAEGHDRDATFPTQNWADMRDAGLLGLCIPAADGGLGGDFGPMPWCPRSWDGTAPPPP